MKRGDVFDALFGDIFDEVRLPSIYDLGEFIGAETSPNGLVRYELDRNQGLGYGMCFECAYSDGDGCGVGLLFEYGTWRGNGYGFQQRDFTFWAKSDQRHFVRDLDEAMGRGQ
jgi:hypothetical protein